MFLRDPRADTIDAIDEQVAAYKRLKKRDDRIIIGLCIVAAGGTIGLIAGILITAARHSG